jgi:hypothetical protein
MQTYYNYEKKVLTVMVNNYTNINYTKNASHIISLHTQKKKHLVVTKG